MPTIDIPDGLDPMTYVFGKASPAIGAAAGGFSAATYADSSLPLREFEAARYRIAQINDCQLCLTWRSERGDAGPVGEELYAEVEQWRTATGLTARERLAAEYAERYALDHRNLDADFWGRLRSEFSDDEIVELTLCMAQWLGLGRLNQVLGIDVACAI
ncbi:MAG: carboxymuconolactone decarboxylase family protein [Acidimicrobiales bacterium]|jgi:alkylhydroperoxidase family enzyme|nr:carboxymuconolactone decarboxylase family protein [Acidimicrobiales bacterium]